MVEIDLDIMLSGVEKVGNPQFTVNPVGPVFHLFSLGNPDFIIYMAELRPDEFGMNFQP